MLYQVQLDEMPAARTVFDIAELLEIIICQVDAHQIRELKLVNKSWRDAIISSKAIGRAPLVDSYEAVDVSDEDLERMKDDIPAIWTHDTLLNVHYSTPAYDWFEWIRINPGLTKVYAWKWHWRSLDDSAAFKLTIRLPSTMESSTLDCLEEYLTDPPCMTVAVAAFGWQDSTWAVPSCSSTCWVYSETGLKVKDVLAVRDQVDATRGLAGQKTIDMEVMATLRIVSDEIGPRDAIDRMLLASYFEGPLPRYRKATHQLDEAGVAAYNKDKEMQWEPDMDTDGSTE